ncbi:unnamed protein product, partial [Scytosiphon promiscuus]
RGVGLSLTPLARAVRTRQVCPLLLRCFWTQQRHRRGEDYSNVNSLPRDELQIYTWPDATVREITTLIQGVVPAARRRQGRLSYAFVYPDSQGKQVLRQVNLTKRVGLEA